MRFAIIRPHGALASLVDAIWEWDVPDGAAALALSSDRLPSPCPLLILHYRAPMWSDLRGGPGFYRRVAIGIQTGVTRLRASGPVGVVTVRLKPEAVSTIIGADPSALTDTRVELSDLFPGSDFARLQEALVNATNSAQRIAHVEAFLLRRRRHRPKNPALSLAASWLRQNPALPIHRVARHFDISERQLSRSFRASFGIGPKHFSRIVRIGKVVAARRRGLTWADTAQRAGFVDQAHMINDFSSMVGLSPDEFFRTAAAGQKCRELNASLGASDFCNSFVR